MINIEHKELEKFLYTYDLTIEQFINSSLPLLKTVYKTMQPKTEPINIRYMMEQCLDDTKEIEGGWVFTANDDIPIYILWEEKDMKIEHDTIILSHNTPDMYLEHMDKKHTVIYLEPFHLSVKKLLRTFRILYEISELKNPVLLQVKVTTKESASSSTDGEEQLVCKFCNKHIKNTSTSLCSHKNKRCPKIGEDKGNNKGKNMSYEDVFTKIIT